MHFLEDRMKESVAFRYYLELSPTFPFVGLLALEARSDEKELDTVLAKLSAIWVTLKSYKHVKPETKFNSA